MIRCSHCLSGHHIIISRSVSTWCWSRSLAHVGALTQVELLDTARYLTKAIIKLLWLEEGCLGLNHALRICLMEESSIVHLHVVDCLDLGFVEPFYPLAVLPQTELHLVIFGNDVCAETVLFTLVPIAFIAALISPRVDSEAVLLVVFVLTAVHSSVIPDVNSHALHIIVEPFALVLTAVKP